MYFYLKNENSNSNSILLYCSSSINSKKICKANITFYNIDDLNINSKTLYMNDTSTNLNVTFNKPTTFKFIKYYYVLSIHYYSSDDIESSI